MRCERLSNDEETYSTIFTALRHTIRRRILRMLANEPMAFTDILNQLGIESSHLTYHLDSLGVLLTKTEKGQYLLSTFGRAAVATMGWVEEASKTEPQPAPLTTTWKAIVVVLVVGVAVFASAYYNQGQALRGLQTAYNGLHTDYAGLSEDFTQLTAEHENLLEEQKTSLQQLRTMKEILDSVLAHPDDHSLWVYAWFHEAWFPAERSNVKGTIGEG
jgi:DNA-binding transcriptional ArsR family regulator